LKNVYWKKDAVWPPGYFVSSVGIDELQKDLYIFVRQYNEERSHGGYRTKGRAPLQTLREWIKKPNREKGCERAA